MREYLEQGLLPSTTLYCSVFTKFNKKILHTSKTLHYLQLSTKHPSGKQPSQGEQRQTKENGRTKVSRISTIVVFN